MLFRSREDDEEEDDDETVFDRNGGHLEFECLFSLLLQLKLLGEEVEGSADCSRFSVIIGWLL